MGNIFDYLSWRGDISLDIDPFNEVDSLILAQLSYANLTELIPQGICNLSITISELANKFFETHTLEEECKKTLLEKSSAMLFWHLKDSPRFGDMKVFNYVDNYSHELQKQFSAITVQIDDDTLYVAYRGTDDTIIGWKEDFNMAFLPTIPAQEDARRYLHDTAAVGCERLIVGGHSKGGNLAIYAAINAKPSIKERIDLVYNCDGPGFQTQTLESDAYRQMIPKIRTIVPESSVVGMLFGHEEAYEIVRSSQKGIMQHDACSWEIVRNGFCYLESTSNESKFFDKSVKMWVEGLDEETRRVFVDGVFSLLEAGGASTISELTAGGFKSLTSATKLFSSMPLEVRQNLISVSTSLVEIMASNWKAGVKPNTSKRKLQPAKE